jgi:DNA mismatch endonuclease Vsr
MPNTHPDVRERMKRVRRHGTTPELLVGKFLRSDGLFYRKNVKGLPGRPDFANQAKRWAVFVNGCFWHHHTACMRGRTPANNSEFWRTKFARNRARDARSIVQLRRAGFEVLLVWECELACLSERIRRFGRKRQSISPRGD